MPNDNEYAPRQMTDYEWETLSPLLRGVVPREYPKIWLTDKMIVRPDALGEYIHEEPDTLKIRPLRHVKNPFLTTPIEIVAHEGAHMLQRIGGGRYKIGSDTRTPREEDLLKSIYSRGRLGTEEEAHAVDELFDMLRTRHFMETLDSGPESYYGEKRKEPRVRLPATPEMATRAAVMQRLKNRAIESQAIDKMPALWKLFHSMKKNLTDLLP